MPQIPLKMKTEKYRLVEWDELIVGAHAIGRNAEQMIGSLAMLIKMGVRKQDFDNTVALHPTAGEEWVLMDPKYEKE